MTEKSRNTNPVMIFVPYDAVFGDCVATFDYFKQVVKLLSRTDTLFWCARLNLILADPKMDEKTKQEYYLNCFFTAQQIQALNKFVMAHGGSDHVGVLHRPSVHFLAEEFRQELQPDSLDVGGWMRKGRFLVAPLIVITIDEMRRFYESNNKTYPFFRSRS